MTCEGKKLVERGQGLKELSTEKVIVEEKA